MLSSSRTSSRAGLRPASEMDSVMKFDPSGAIQLASRSTSSPELVADLVSDLSQTGSSYLGMSW